MINIQYPIIICVTVLLHCIWAVGLVIEPNAVNATGLHTIMLIPPHDPSVAAGIFASVAGLAVLGLISTKPFLRTFLILPQQVTLWFSMVGVVNAMLLGQFADGVQRSHWFLIVDQIPIVLITLGHTAALLVIAGKDHG